MSAVTVSLCSTLMFVLFVCAEPSIIIAKSGQDITLTCRAPNNNSSKIIVVEWIRDDLGDKNVLLYRDRKFAPATQHPYFKNQVDLQDRQMKDGDVSLILKNVTIKDTGTYECHVFMEGAQSWQILSSTNLHVLPPDPKIIAAESGKNVILTCRTPNNNIRVVEWSRADLGEKYVLFYQDGHFVPHNQHRSFVNRVDLQDRQMEDGDVSLILKDVTINDTGTYECRVRKGNNRRKRANLSGDPISSIDLHVVPPGHTGGDAEDGSAGLIVVLSVFAVLLVVAVFGFLIHKKPVFRFNECNLLFNPV